MKTLKILTIILSLLIIIGIGHGIVPMVVLEMMSVYALTTGEFEFNILGSYEGRLVAVSLMSLIGQLFLILTFFFNAKLRSALIVAGCVLLLAAMFILTTGASDMTFIAITSIFGLPLVVTTSMLLFTEASKLINR